tara:strand:- start:3008 stop:3907 length:900 start_codon:yes stop_codon:yes gene_type:complete
MKFWILEEKKMKARAFVPGNITGFFVIIDHSNTLLCGSTGCGFVLNKGVITTIQVKKTKKPSIDILLDGKPCDCPVTQKVVSLMGDSTKNVYLKINHELQLPMKYGFGMSAAGALGAALALNRALNLNMTRLQCGQIAHSAEILNKTGLGDVISELEGGLLLRRRAGAPGIGETYKIKCDDYAVSFLIGKELDTKTILLDESKKKRINNIGEKCLNSFTGNISTAQFLKVSRRFAFETSLMSNNVRLAVEKLQSQDIVATMIMLGNAVFTLTENPETVSNILNYPSVITKIDNRGARII